MADAPKLTPEQAADIVAALKVGDAIRAAAHAWRRPAVADVEIPAHLTQLVDRLTGSEGEQLTTVGVPADRIVAFARLWQAECLPILIDEVERVAAMRRHPAGRKAVGRD